MKFGNFSLQPVAQKKNGHQSPPLRTRVRGRCARGRGEEAVGFSSGFSSHAFSGMVKEAYRKKAWETHPDRFPAYEKLKAESRFKLISEAYTCLQTGAGHGNSAEAMHVRVVRRGGSTAHRANSALIKVPFILLIFGTISLGGLNASRAYRRQKVENPSITRNPFLP